MAFSTAEQVDFLWKKVVYGVTDTNNGGKAGPEETIGSPLLVFAKNILSQSVPNTAPGSTTGTVQFYGPTTLSAVHCTADPTVAGNKTWLATSTYGSINSRLINWIPPSVDASYLIEVFKNDPSVGANMLNGTSNGYEWVFDYQAGVLTFPNSLPAGITNLYIVGYQYIGTTGLGGAGANVYVDQTTYVGSTVTSGSVTLTSFFTHAPQANSGVVMFNGVRIDSSAWSYSGTNLIINVSNLPYDLEATDVISADYAFAATG
jgi:hypothetical protein